MSANVSVIFFLDPVMHGEETVHRVFTRTESEEKATNIFLDFISRVLVFYRDTEVFLFHRMLVYLRTNQWKNEDEDTAI